MNFNESALGKEYFKYSDLKEIALNTNILDLSKISWFFPTCLLPLGIFIKEHKEIHVIPPKDIDASNYINIIMKRKIDSVEKSYIPITEIPPNYNFVEKILDPFLSYLDNSKGNLNAFGYFIGELIDNIYEHSEFSTAYIMAQRYKRKKYTEIGIIDNGISIPKSFDNKGYNFDDKSALEEAVEGLSTKYEDERGFGLKTSLNILTEEFKANTLIVSRCAGLIVNPNNRFFFNLEWNNIFNGTLISTRFLNKVKNVDITNYLE